MKKHTTHILKIQLYYITIKQIVLIQSNIKKSKKSMLIVMTWNNGMHEMIHEFSSLLWLGCNVWGRRCEK